MSSEDVNNKQRFDTREFHMRTTTILTAMIFASFLPSAVARANSLDEALTNMAGQIVSYLKSQDKTTVSIGDFDGPDGSTAGRAIQQQLQEKLVSQQIEVKKLGARYKIRGSFFLQTDTDSSVATIKSTLVDENGREMTGFRERVQLAEVRSLEDLSRLFGLTVDLVTEKSGGEKAATNVRADQLIAKVDKAVSTKVEQSIKSPSFAFDKTSSRVKATNKSSFVVQLLRRPLGTLKAVPLDIIDESGFAFAPLQDGDAYEVTVINNADHDVAAKISIDGVNSFHFSENLAFRENGSWVVGARSQGLIRGWYINNASLREFLVTSDSKDSGLPDPLDLGTITVQFFHCWKPDSPTPQIEVLAGLTRDQLRTTQGNLIGQLGQTTERIFGKQLLASVSIRYSNPIDLPPPDGAISK